MGHGGTWFRVIQQQNPDEKKVVDTKTKKNIKKKKEAFIQEEQLETNKQDKTFYQKI